MERKNLGTILTIVLICLVFFAVGFPGGFDDGSGSENVSEDLPLQPKLNEPPTGRDFFCDGVKYNEDTHCCVYKRSDQKCSYQETDIVLGDNGGCKLEDILRNAGHPNHASREKLISNIVDNCKPKTNNDTLLNAFCPTPDVTTYPEECYFAEDKSRTVETHCMTSTVVDRGTADCPVWPKAVVEISNDCFRVIKRMPDGTYYWGYYCPRE